MIIKVLLVDDIRTAEEVAGVLWAARHHRAIFFNTCRTYNEGLAAIQKDTWDIMFLDYNLRDKNGTGYDLLKYLKKNPDKIPKQINLISSLPVERQKMQALVSELFKTKKS